MRLGLPARLLFLEDLCDRRIRSARGAAYHRHHLAILRNGPGRTVEGLSVLRPRHLEAVRVDSGHREGCTRGNGWTLHGSRFPVEMAHRLQLEVGLIKDKTIVPVADHHEARRAALEFMIFPGSREAAGSGGTYKGGCVIEASTSRFVTGGVFNQGLPVFCESPAVCGVKPAVHQVSFFPGMIVHLLP